MLSTRIAARPRRALLALLAFILLAGVVGGPVAGALDSSGGFVAPGADAQIALDRIEHASGAKAGAGVVLLVDDPARAQAAARRLDRVPGIARTAVGDPSGGYALVRGTLAAGTSDDDVGKAAVDAFDGVRGVTVGGPVVASEQIGSTVGEDLGRAELIAFPFLLVLSLLFFRGRAALMPVAVGLTTVLGTFLVLRTIDAFVYGLNVFALNLVIGLGLGLAIDYTLFLVTRLREELGRGAEVPDAIATTMRTAGRTVAYSAATVAAALATLLVFPQAFLKSMGLAGATVAIVAAVAALLVSPALMSLWGRKLMRRDAAAGGDAADGRWHRVASAVMRRPGTVAITTAAVMLAVAAPALTTKWTPVDASTVPAGLSARVVADRTADDPRAKAPVIVDLAAPGASRAQLAAYAQRVARIDGVERVAGPRALGSGGEHELDVFAAGDSAGSTARDVVAAIRSLDAPGEAKVGGPAAAFIDQQAAIANRLPLALVLLVGLTMVVLWLMTGSVVLPIKAVVMNALTVGAALSPLVIVFGGAEPSDFLVTAAIVFALSTDYGVFLLGRIREEREAGRSERDAVAAGIGATGRVITAAAILLAVAIGAFSTSSVSFIQQIGVATATGVLIDAFIVRTLLVPSLMALLGKWNWWSPKPLRGLHARLGVVA